MRTSRKGKLRRGTDDILFPAWGQGVENDAWAALAGARYHLDQMRTLWDAGFPDGLTNPFHFHLRGFFWELYAAGTASRTVDEIRPGFAKLREHCPMLSGSRK